MATDPYDELREVLSHYDLGELVRYKRDQRGTVNVSYSVETLKDGRPGQYFLRRYKSGITHDEILFEHSLIDHLVEYSHCPVARLHRTRSGSTFFLQPAESEAQPASYYAVFDFLHGEDRYTWIDPHCTTPELASAGQLLADYHTAVSTLVCEGRRAESKILDLLDEIEQAWEVSPARSKGTAFDRYLAQNFDAVRHGIAETRAALATPILRTFPEVVIHSDFHPGNLVFAGDDICGLVDFDWSKIDLRTFDVALAVWYFCASWKGERDGELRLKDARSLLEAYQRRLMASSSFPPLSHDELAYLPALICAADIYVLYWGLREYFTREVDPEEYLVYLKHCTAFLRWCQAPGNRQALSAILADIPRP